MAGSHATGFAPIPRRVAEIAQEDEVAPANRAKLLIHKGEVVVLGRIDRSHNRISEKRN